MKMLKRINRSLKQVVGLFVPLPHHFSDRMIESPTYKVVFFFFFFILLVTLFGYVLLLIERERGLVGKYFVVSGTENI